MVRSMTGYGHAKVEENDFSLAVTAKSTNHRFLDIQVRLPNGLEILDPLLRRRVKELLGRGHLELTVTMERKGQAEVKLDRNVFDAYVRACQKLRRDFGFQREPDLVSLMRFPGVVVSGNEDPFGQEVARIQPVVERAATAALTNLNQMRAREGEALRSDIQSRIQKLEKLVESVAEIAGRVPQLWQDRLRQRLETLLNDNEVEPSRLAQEVAYLASHSDIAEELARLHSHLGQAAKLLTEDAEIGKRLDFLLQEMNREANTILSKTTDVPEVGLEISRQGIEMKTEIEKLREQAQNIE